jgi:trehalose/maltose hydrolase-like predicted phosphorylase
MSRWSLEYDSWVPEEEKLRESLCTLGNGYIAVRGATEESGQRTGHYHGTYLAGGYDRAETLISGRIIENEDLVNWPDFTGLCLRVKEGEWFSLENVRLLGFKQKLDIKKGLLQRSIHFILDGKETLIETFRFVSMDNPHLAGFRWEVTALNWEGEIEVKSIIDGSVTNNGVERYKDLNGKHLVVEDRGLAFEDTVFMLVKTKQSGIEMAITSRTSITCEKAPWSVTRQTFVEEDEVGQVLSCHCRMRKKINIEKIVAVFTSKDFAISHPLVAAKNLLQSVSNFSELLKKHELSWLFLWRRFNISLDSMDEETKILRLHIFHLLQTACHNSVERDVSIPARGLHGEAYRGHIFWDEMFIFPMIYFRMPKLSRSLLMYRYRRLDEARLLARSQGLKGAMFPWQSGSDGREESQEIHLNPESGRWIPDNTHKQRHINGAVAYNIVKYYEATNDREYLENYGAEIILDIARFWVSMLQFNHAKNRYEILGVVGPDEFHTKYPDSDKIGIDNNAYTNVLASWSIRKAVELLNSLTAPRKEELLEKMAVTRGDLVQWIEISKRVYIPFLENGLMAQFEGYEKLKQLDWDKYRQKYENLQRLDRILEAEGDDVNHYKVNKQADVLMLFYLFSAHEIGDAFKWLGYRFDTTSILENIKYYIDHSSRGSSLSRIVHSWVIARSDRKNAWSLFQEALQNDISDIQDGTTSEGIHLGAMAGTVDIVQRCFIGLEIKDDVLWFNPQIPDELSGIKLSLCYRGHWLSVKLDRTCLVIYIERSWEPNGKIGFKGEVHEFKEGSVFNFSMEGTHRQTQLT